MEKLQLNIESLIFTAEKPIKIKDIKLTLEKVLDTNFKEEDLRSEIDALMEKYQSEQFSFEIVEISNGFQFMTKGAYYSLIAELLKLQSKKKLSKTALETLAIIAYKQPATKSDIEHIRGVVSDYSVAKLLDKDLICIVGRSDTPGRPLQYGTSEKFMDHFNLKSLNDLPKLKEFELEENSIGFQSSDNEPDVIKYHTESELTNEEEKDEDGKGEEGNGVEGSIEENEEKNNEAVHLAEEQQFGEENEVEVVEGESGGEENDGGVIEDEENEVVVEDVEKHEENEHTNEEQAVAEQIVEDQNIEVFHDEEHKSEEE